MALVERIVLVTGGTGHLGKHVTLGLLEAEATVAVTYRDPAEWKATQDVAGPHAPRLYGYQCDLGDEDQVRHVVQTVVSRHERIDAFVHLAGGYTPGTVWETDASTWRKQWDLNVGTLVTALRHIVPVLREQKVGRIVATASAAALESGAGMAAYAVTKQAVVKIVDTLAAELRHDGIGVYCIAPGTVDTPANRKAMPESDFSLWVRPAHVAKVVAFLCSDDAQGVRSVVVPITE